MKKRILPLLMASSMMVSVTSPLFAQETDAEFDSVTTEFVEDTQSLEKVNEFEATANGVSYSTLKEALEAGGEVKLLKDVSVDEFIRIDNDTTLDLGDFTITNNFKATTIDSVSKGRPFEVYANNFTIKAKKGGMVIPESNTEAYGFVESYATNLSILGGNYSGNTFNGTYFRIKNTKQEGGTGTLNVQGIEVHTNNQIIRHHGYTFDTFSATISNCKLYAGKMAFYFDVLDTTETSTIKISNTTAVVDKGPVIEVAGGNTVLSDNDWIVTGNYDDAEDEEKEPWSRAAVGVGYGANVTIKSGNYSAKSEHMKVNEGYGVYIYTSGGLVNIEGGTFEGSTASLRAAVDAGMYPNATSNIIVNGGQFTGDLLAATNADKEKITVNAGDFNGLTKEVTLAEGNNVQINGGSFNLDVTDKVKEEKAVITVTRRGNERFYIGEEKIEEALNNAVPGDVVDIIQKIDKVTVPGGVTVTNSSVSNVTVNGTVVEPEKEITIPTPPSGGGSTAKVSPVYRAYNPNNGEHLYTLDEKEYKHVVSLGWHEEGIAFMAEEEKNGFALFRVYNPNSGLHHYTLDETEKNILVSLGWQDEDVAWYTSKKPQSAPVYRVYNPNDGNHHYTMDGHEKDVLVSLGWHDEGLAFRTAPIETK